MPSMNPKLATKAIKLLGGLTKTANRLDRYRHPDRPELTPAAVCNWRKRGVPVEYCIAVEKELAGKIHRSQLRPDIYPPEEYQKVAI